MLLPRCHHGSSATITYHFERNAHGKFTRVAPDVLSLFEQLYAFVTHPVDERSNLIFGHVTIPDSHLRNLACVLGHLFFLVAITASLRRFTGGLLADFCISSRVLKASASA